MKSGMCNLQPTCPCTYHIISDEYKTVLHVKHVTFNYTYSSPMQLCQYGCKNKTAVDFCILLWYKNPPLLYDAALEWTKCISSVTIKILGNMNQICLLANIDWNGKLQIVMWLLTHCCIMDLT